MSPDLNGLACLAWVQLWQVTAVALLIRALVRFGCRDRPRLAYALWMLVIIKSIVPPVWSSPTGLFSWARIGGATARHDLAGQPPGRLIAPLATDSRAETPTLAANDPGKGTVSDPGRDGTGLRPVAFAIWSVGLALCATFMLGKQLVCLSLIRRSSLPVDERYNLALAELSGRLGVRREVRLVVTSRSVGPAVFGLVRPSILLPGPLLAGVPWEQVKLILAHELIHVRRRDVLVGKLQLVAQLVWWFHPLVWWANRGAYRERERCCDEEVIAGVGCQPALYARTLLSVLEQKGRLRTLAALPGVRALEVTSLRLESIMKFAEIDHRRDSWITRLAFAAGLALLIPGTGLTLQAQPPVQDDAAVSAPAKTATRTLRGVVREMGTDRPVVGARVSVGTATDGADRTSTSTVTDGAGRYTITDLPSSHDYDLVVLPKPGEPYLITSRKVEATDDEAPLTADVEFVRGIPFRVRVLDRETGQPLQGMLSYFPINPNNPFDRGVMGYVGTASKDTLVLGAFYEAGPDDQGQYRGAVLPGPGLLGFRFPVKPGDEPQADRKPVVSFPDGKSNMTLTPSDIGLMASVPVGSDPLQWTMLPLGQYDAVIAIDPREGMEVATYEIRIDSDKAHE